MDELWGISVKVGTPPLAISLKEMSRKSLDFLSDTKLGRMKGLAARYTIGAIYKTLRGDVKILSNCRNYKIKVRVVSTGQVVTDFPVRSIIGRKLKC